MIREVDPPRPSVRVTARGASAERTRLERIDAARLTSQLKGDLDWITMKSLEKDRTRRYGSASDLAADLRRHLDDQPVLASPPSTVYRVQKFVRRNRLAVTASATLVVLLMAFATTMAVQARRIAQARDRASREAAVATQVSDFLVGLFNVSDPSEARGNTLTAREILDKGAEKIEKDLAAQPEVQARLLETIGTVYNHLGLWGAAEPMLRRAVAADRRALGDDHPQTVNAVSSLASVYEYQGRLKEAEPLNVEVIERRRRRLGEEHSDTLRTNDDLASLYVLQSRFDEAQRLVKKTLETQRRVLGPEHTDTLYPMNILQSLYFRQGHYVDAAPVAREVVEIELRTLGEGHPATLTNMHNLATVYDRLGRDGEAEQVYTKTIQGRRRVLGPAHPRTALSMQALAKMYQKQQRYAESESQLLAASDALADAPGVDTRTTQAVVTQLADLYNAWGKPAKAAEWRARLAKEPVPNR